MSRFQNAARFLTQSSVSSYLEISFEKHYRNGFAVGIAGLGIHLAQGWKELGLEGVSPHHVGSRDVTRMA